MKRNFAWSILLAAVSCTMSRSPSAGSETHFLHECSASCAAPYACLCGVCSLACDDSQVCGKQTPAASCLAPAAASCNDAPRLCDLECKVAADCSALGSGARCSAGRCRAGAVESDAGTSRDASVHDSSMPAIDSGIPTSTDKLCDGSSDIRLSVSTGGGFIAPVFTFTNPRGSGLFFIDGKCHYYACSDYMLGIVEGDLSAAEATQLANSIGWANRVALRGSSPAMCADGGSTVVTMPDSAFACTCGDCGTGSPAGKTAAVSSALKLASMFAPRGTPLAGPVSAVAFTETTSGFKSLPWPLSRSVASISGLVQTMNVIPVTGVLFDQPADISALRKLRMDFRSANTGINFALVDSSGLYSVYIRDELPDAVAKSYDAFVANGQMWLK